MSREKVTWASDEADWAAAMPGAPKPAKTNDAGGPKNPRSSLHHVSPWKNVLSVGRPGLRTGPHKNLEATVGKLGWGPITVKH
jgi:hypothetical protein